ncbi:MAG TPA: phosphatase PAP2 family protein, partial [Methanobacterium sp.]|nr:phosphatase PAP2 family protein [Methanobacterium sp.]
ALGVAGPSIALIYVFGPLGLVFSLIIPLVMWSRLYLKKHTVSQVIMGAVLGLVFTSLQIYYLI